nr:hypothetical protein CFP56_71280 [Quercus suber]
MARKVTCAAKGVFLAVPESGTGAMSLRLLLVTGNTMLGDHGLYHHHHDLHYGHPRPICSVTQMHDRSGHRCSCDCDCPMISASAYSFSHDMNYRPKSTTEGCCPPRQVSHRPCPAVIEQVDDDQPQQICRGLHSMYRLGTRG